jgi:hypothetical protein
MKEGYLPKEQRKKILLYAMILECILVLLQWQENLY